MADALDVTAAGTDPAAPRPQPRDCADLFWSFTWLALQGFGGVLAVVQRELVEKKRWMTNDEFVEDWAVAQIMPGPNVVNLSIMIGERYFGWRGAVAALAQDTASPVTSRIARVTVYPGSATVERVARVPAGARSITLGCLPASCACRSCP